MDFNPLSLLQMMGSGENGNTENMLKILSAMNGNGSGMTDALSGGGISALLPLLQNMPNMKKTPPMKSGDNVNATIFNLMTKD